MLLASTFTFLVSMHFASGDILILPVEGRFIEAEIYDEPAAFGNGLPYEGLHGMVIYADPPNGCETMSAAPSSDNRTGRWILLVARYNCSFELKVRNAQQANYDAVIVHNIDSNDLEKMSANNSTGIRIPAVFIGERDGVNMRQFYANTTDYFVIINNETRVNWHKLLVPFVIVVSICFLVMVVCMTIKFMRERRRQRRERLSSSALNKMPIHKFQKGDPYDTCAICLEDYVDGEKLRVLPCAHAYHSKCIDPWLTKNKRVCPVCKRRVFGQDETPFSDSDSDTDSDDTTPLLAGGNVQGTLGGTFTTHRLRIAALMEELNAAVNSINGDHSHDDADSSSTDSSIVMGCTSDDEHVVDAPADGHDVDTHDGHEVYV